MVISEAAVQAYEAKVFTGMKLSKAVYANSIAYGKEVAAHILAWASKDRYKETRALAKYGKDGAYQKITHENIANKLQLDALNR